VQPKHVPDNRHAEHSGVTFPFLYKLEMFTRNRIITNASIDILLRHAVAHMKTTNNVISTVPNYSHGPNCGRGMYLTICNQVIQVYHSHCHKNWKFSNTKIMSNEPIDIILHRSLAKKGNEK